MGIVYSENMFRYLLLASILYSLSACQPSNDSKEFNNEKVIHEIKQMFDDYHEDIKRKGLTAEFKYLDQSNNFFWVPPGYESALNYDSVKNILVSNSSKFKHIEFHWDTLQIFPLSKNIANYSGIVDGKMTDTSNTILMVTIIESGTLIKRQDGWKLLNGQSANLPEDQ